MRREHDRKYYLLNKARIIKQSVQYLREHPEQRSGTNHRYNHSEKGKAAIALWRIKNGADVAEKARLRRLIRMQDPAFKKLEAERHQKRRLEPGFIEKERIRSLAKSKTFNSMANHVHQAHMRRMKQLCNTNPDAKKAIKLIRLNAKKCFYCGCKVTRKTLHIDHVKPIAKGGFHTAFNLVPSCKKCNYSKGSKQPNDFIKSGQQLLVY